MTLTVGSLFSGIGGLDLGLERAGMKVIWQSEIDPYANRVLKKHWPEVVNHGNIKEINWQEIEKPDVICGGYPCQPFSTAGKRRGEEDPRHLWPWVREAISQLRPRYAILENVRGHLSLGGLSVIGELASIGYDCEWRVVSAASVGANHRRDRIIIIAYPQRQLANTNNAGSGTPECRIDGDGQTEVKEWQNQPQFRASGFGANVAHAPSEHSNGKFDNTRDSEQSRPLSEFGNCGGAQNVANTNSNNAPNGRQCEAVSSQSGSRRNDRSGSGSDFGQVSVGSPGEGSSNVANADSQQLGQRGFTEHTGQTHRRWVYNGNREASNGVWEWWQVEPDVGRVANGIPNRVDRLKCLGNAVVPQVAEVIGRLVIAHANHDTLNQ